MSIELVDSGGRWVLSEAWRGGRVGLSDTCYLKTSRNEWEYEGCLGIRFRGGRRGMDSFTKTSFGGIGVFQAWIRGFLDSFLVFFFSVGNREGVFDCTSHFVGGEWVGRYGSWGVG